MLRESKTICFELTLWAASKKTSASSGVDLKAMVWLPVNGRK